MLCRVPHTPPIRRSDDEGQRVKMDNSFLCVCVCAVLLRHVCIPYGGLVYFVYRTRSAAQWTARPVITSSSCGIVLAGLTI